MKENSKRKDPPSVKNTKPPRTCVISLEASHRHLQGTPGHGSLPNLGVRVGMFLAD